MSCLPDCRTPTGVQAHCGACHRTFSRVSGFDRHRKYGECVDPASLGFAVNDRGIWRQPPPPDGSFRPKRQALGLRTGVAGGSVHPLASEGPS